MQANPLAQIDCTKAKLDKVIAFTMHFYSKLLEWKFRLFNPSIIQMICYILSQIKIYEEEIHQENK